MIITHIQIMRSNCDFVDLAWQFSSKPHWISHGTDKNLRTNEGKILNQPLSTKKKIVLHETSPRRFYYQLYELRIWIVSEFFVRFPFFKLFFSLQVALSVVKLKHVYLDLIFKWFCWDANKVRSFFKLDKVVFLVLIILFLHFLFHLQLFIIFIF